MSDEKRTFFCRGRGRESAIRCIAEAPEGWRVTVEPPKRGSDINAALHAMLGEIAEHALWAGKRHDIETWKRLLVAAWTRANGEHVVMLPALDGTGVDIVFRRTSQMTQAEVRDLLGFIEAWAAENLPQEAEA